MVDWAKLAADMSEEGDHVPEAEGNDLPAEAARSTQEPTTGDQASASPDAAVSNTEAEDASTADRAPAATANEMPPGPTDPGRPSALSKVASKVQHRRPRDLKDFHENSIEEETKTGPFRGESAGPWRIGEADSAEEDPVASMISTITDPKMKLEPGAKRAPSGSSLADARAADEKDVEASESESAGHQRNRFAPLLMMDDEDEEPSRTQLLPEREMLERLEEDAGDSDEDAATTLDLSGPAAMQTPSSGQRREKEPSISSLRDQAKASTGPFAPPTSQPSAGKDAEPASPTHDRSTVDAASAARADDESESDATAIDNPDPRARPLKGFHGLSDEASSATIRAHPAEEQPSAASRLGLSEEEDEAAMQFFGHGDGDDDQTDHASIVASQEDEADVTLQLSSTESTVESERTHDDPFAQVAAYDDDEDSLPGGQARIETEIIKTRRFQTTSEVSDEVDRPEPKPEPEPEPEPEERSHFARNLDISPWTEDDENPSLVMARAQTRTRFLSVVGLGILLIAGLVALWTIIPSIDHEAAAGTTASADQQAEANNDTSDKASAGEAAASKSGKKATPAKVAGNKKPRKAARGRREDKTRQTAGRTAARVRPPSDTAAKAPSRGASLPAGRGPGSKAQRTQEQQASRTNRMAAASVTGAADAPLRERQASQNLKPKKGKTTDGTVAGATTREISVTAPVRIIWRTPTGKKLGSGSGFIRLVPGVSTVVAHDPFSNVRTFIKVKNDRIAYDKLPKGKLDIRAFPYAAVYAGKRKLGDAPFPPLQVIEGQYRLRFVYEGEVRKRIVKVKNGRTARVKVNFLK